MSTDLSVVHVGNDQFKITVRGHDIQVDQPDDAGGEDTGPTPTELFVAGLLSCVAFYGRRFLARHQIDTDGFAVSGSFAIGGRPTRVTDISIILTPPDALPTSRREAFFAVASGCTVHHTLEQPPSVTIVLSTPDGS